MVVRLISFWPVVFALAVWLGGDSRANADPIDEKLFRLAPRMVKELRESGYANVGVLKFQVQIGAKAPTLTGGRLTANLATRLENALMLELADDRPLGVARGAGAWAARKAPTATYVTAEGKNQLFDLKYPLCWGNKEAAVDAFLTGTVHLSDNLQQTTISLVVFDKKQSASREMARFTVRTDRGLLADLGLNFCFAQHDLDQLLRLPGLGKLDKEAVSDAHVRQTNLSPKAWPEEDVIELKLKWADKIVPLSAQLPVALTPKLPALETYTLLVRNKLDERVGIVLRVNGKNVLHEEATDIEVWRSAMLVLEPKGEYSLGGYRGKNQAKTHSFKLLPAATALGPLTNHFGPGLIELHIFRAGGKGPSIERMLLERTIALRAVTGTEPTLEGLQEKIRKALSPRALAAREFLLVGPDADDLREVSLTNPLHTGALFFHLNVVK